MLHFGSREEARGVTDPGVGSGALLGGADLPGKKASNSPRVKNPGKTCPSNYQELLVAVRLRLEMDWEPHRIDCDRPDMGRRSARLSPAGVRRLGPPPIPIGCEMRRALPMSKSAPLAKPAARTR